MNKKIVLIVIAVVILAVCSVLIYLSAKLTQDGYTQEQIDAVEMEGQEAGAAYRTYLEKILSELQRKIKNSDEALPNEEFDKFIANIADKMKEQDESIEELTAARLATLENTRETLVSMRDFYAGEVELLKTQRDDLDAKIAELEEVNEGIENGGGAGYTQELAGFVSLRDYIVSLIASYEDNISKLDVQIAEVSEIIDGLKTEVKT